MHNKKSVAPWFHPGQGWDASAEVEPGRYRMIASRFWSLAIVFGLAVSTAWADAPRSAVQQAEQLLATGEAARALETFRDLQVDHPEDPAVQFGVACSLLLMGSNAAAVDDPEAAAKAYGEARTVFDTLKTAAPSAAVRLQAAYNAGNACLYTAQLLSAEQEYEQKLSMYRQAVTAFEDALDREAGHAGAQQNLDHARFQLKQLLQNPPEKEEQDQQEPPPDQPKAVAYSEEEVTEIPGAEVVPEEGALRLQFPGGQQ